jgi:thiosulfate/3-mercaptopyruvate sulfurtransferase
MGYTTLISTVELDQHLTHPDWVILDCRFQLKDINYGRRTYEQAHIAGAAFADLNADLSGPIVPGKTSRHPLPSVEFTAQRFSHWGIAADTQVVAYDEAGGALAAARLWWMLRWLGHDRVAVLDGGWQKWQQENRSISSRIENRASRTFTPKVRSENLLTVNDVIDSLDDPAFKLIDARAADRYRGENEIIDPIAGHIPGAVSTPYLENLDRDGVFKSKEDLRAKYAAVLGDLPAERVGVYCGSGGTAPHTILAMLHAGLGEAKLYAGSWSEWIIDPARPIKIGNETTEE